MSINRNADRENLHLENGYKEVLIAALDFNNSINKDYPLILARNKEIERDLGYVREDGTLSCFKSMLPKYVYMLIENYAELANKMNEFIEMFKEVEGEKNNDTASEE